MDISLIFPHHRHINNDRRKAKMVKIGKKARTHQTTEKKNASVIGICCPLYVTQVTHHTRSSYTFPYMKTKSHPYRSNIDKSMNGKVLQIMASFSKLEQPKTANDKLLYQICAQRRIQQRQHHFYMLSTAKYLFLLFNCSNVPLIVQTNRKSVRIAFNQFDFGMGPNESRIHCYWWPKSVKLLAHWSNERADTGMREEENWINGQIGRRHKATVNTGIVNT